MAIMLGISFKNLDVLLKYLGGLHYRLKKLMILKPRKVNDYFVKEQHL